MSLGVLHCKKRLLIFPSPAGIKFPPREGLGIVTSQLGTGKWLTFFTVLENMTRIFGVFFHIRLNNF
jgi:hypothetical protein